MRIVLLLFLFMIALEQPACGDDLSGSSDGDHHGDSDHGDRDTPPDGSPTRYGVVAVPLASSGWTASGRFQVFSGIIAPSTSCATGTRFTSCPLTGVRP